MIEPIDSKLEKSFVEVVEMIQSAKQTVMQTVNTQLVELYWQVGAYISHKLEHPKEVSPVETSFGCSNSMRFIEVMQK
jgi:DUF1016 N-terminal domain